MSMTTSVRWASLVRALAENGPAAFKPTKLPDGDAPWLSPELPCWLAVAACSPDSPRPLPHCLSPTPPGA